MVTCYVIKHEIKYYLSIQNLYSFVEPWSSKWKCFDGFQHELSTYFFLNMNIFKLCLHEHSTLHNITPSYEAQKFPVYHKITRGYQKVRRLMRWNQYLLSYVYKFSREYNTTNVLSVVNIWAIYVDN